jgi:hypothetical protein
MPLDETVHSEEQREQREQRPVHSGEQPQEESLVGPLVVLLLPFLLPLLVGEDGPSSWVFSDPILRWRAPSTLSWCV